MRRPVAVLAVAYATGIAIERYFSVQQAVLYGAGAWGLSTLILRSQCCTSEHGGCCGGRHHHGPAWSVHRGLLRST